MTNILKDPITLNPPIMLYNHGNKIGENTDAALVQRIARKVNRFVIKNNLLPEIQTRLGLDLPQSYDIDMKIAEDGITFIRKTNERKITYTPKSEKKAEKILALINGSLPKPHQPSNGTNGIGNGRVSPLANPIESSSDEEQSEEESLQPRPKANNNSLKDPTNQLALLKDQINKNQSEIRDRGEKINSLQKEVHALTERIEALAEEHSGMIEVALQEVNELKEERSKLAKEALEEINGLKQEKQELLNANKKEVHALEEEHRNMFKIAQQEVNDLNQKLSDAEEQVRALTKEQKDIFVGALQETNGLEKEHSNLLKAALQEVTNLNQKLSDAEEKVRALEIERDDMFGVALEEANELETERNDVHEAALQEVSVLNQKLSDTEKELRALEEEYSNLFEIALQKDIELENAKEGLKPGPEESNESFDYKKEYKNLVVIYAKIAEFRKRFNDYQKQSDAIIEKKIEEFASLQKQLNEVEAAIRQEKKELLSGIEQRYPDLIQELKQTPSVWRKLKETPTDIYELIISKQVLESRLKNEEYKLRLEKIEGQKEIKPTSDTGTQTAIGIQTTEENRRDEGTDKKIEQLADQVLQSTNTLKSMITNQTDVIQSNEQATAKFQDLTTDLKKNFNHRVEELNKNNTQSIDNLEQKVLYVIQNGLDAFSKNEIIRENERLKKLILMFQNQGEIERLKIDNQAYKEEIVPGLEEAVEEIASTYEKISREKDQLESDFDDAEKKIADQELELLKLRNIHDEKKQEELKRIAAEDSNEELNRINRKLKQEIEDFELVKKEYDLRLRTEKDDVTNSLREHHRVLMNEKEKTMNEQTIRIEKLQTQYDHLIQAEKERMVAAKEKIDELTNDLHEKEDLVMLLDNQLEEIQISGRFPNGQTA